MKIEQIWQGLTMEKLIGQGSYGTVYKCFREEHGDKKYSAVKVISIPQTGEEYYSYNTDGMTVEQTREYYKDIVDDFTNEIRILESLKGNKNIVEIKDYRVIEKENEIGWEIFIEMELLTDFNSYAADKTFSEDEALKLGTDLCNALHVCHEKNIIHRDIKPENIFVSEDGDFKLGDFGVSRQLEKTDASMSRKGTFNYMAPEVFYSKKYDSRADVYSLGLVMYKLFNNNRMPFLDTEKQIVKYSERQAAFDRRINGEAIPPLKNISAELNAVILRACEYKPEDRYHNAEEFGKALEKRKLSGVSGWGYRHKNMLVAAVIAVVLVSVIVSMMLVVKPGSEEPVSEKNGGETTEVFYPDSNLDYMESGSGYTKKAIDGRYVYAGKNGVFVFDEISEKTTQLYDKASSAPVFDGNNICFVSDESKSIYKTSLGAESSEKIFVSEINLTEIKYFDDECVIAVQCEETEAQKVYSLVFIDIASQSYEKIAALGDDSYAFYNNGNVVYLENAKSNVAGNKIYTYNIGNRGSVLLFSDAYAHKDFLRIYGNKLCYLSMENENSALSVAVCDTDGKNKSFLANDITDCKDVVYWDNTNIIYTNSEDNCNMYNVAEKKSVPVDKKADAIYTYDGKYYAFEKFDDGYRVNEICTDGSVKGSMHTKNIKNNFDVVSLNKDGFLSWDSDSSTFVSVKTDKFDPVLIEPTEADWKKFDEVIEKYVLVLNEENYDCEKVDSKTFMFSYLLEEYGRSEVYDDFFDEETVFYYSEKPDPKQSFKYYPSLDADTIKEEYDGSYTKLSAEKIEWLAKNIFNVDYYFVEDLSVKKNEYEYFSEIEPYYVDGYYYFHNGDGGGGMNFNLKLKEKKHLANGKISVKIDTFSGYGSEGKRGSFSIVVGLKDIDGGKYWSVYELYKDSYSIDPDHQYDYSDDDQFAEQESVTETAVWDVYPGDTKTVKGTLYRRAEPSVKGELVEYAVLVLDVPVTVNYYSQDEFEEDILDCQLTEIQCAFNGAYSAEEYYGQHITVSAEVMNAHTQYHHTPIVLTDASIDDYLHNNGKKVVFPDTKSNYCELIRDNNGDVLGVDVYISGDYTDDFFYQSRYFGEVKVIYQDNGEFYDDVYSYHQSQIRKTETIYKKDKDGNQHIIDEKYSEFVSEYNGTMNEGYYVVSMMFDRPYSGELFAKKPEEGDTSTNLIFVTFEEGFLGNSEYNFTNYTFNDVLYYGVS